MKTSRCADFAIRVFLPLGLSLMPVGCGGGYPASAKTEVRGEPTPAKAAVEGKKAEVDPEACDPGVEYGGGLGEATLVSIADLMAKPDDLQWEEGPGEGGRLPTSVQRPAVGSTSPRRTRRTPSTSR